MLTVLDIIEGGVTYNDDFIAEDYKYGPVSEYFDFDNAPDISLPGSALPDLFLEGSPPVAEKNSISDDYMGPIDGG